MKKLMMATMIAAASVFVAGCGSTVDEYKEVTAEIEKLAPPGTPQMPEELKKAAYAAFEKLPADQQKKQLEDAKAKLEKLKAEAANK